MLSTGVAKNFFGPSQSQSTLANSGPGRFLSSHTPPPLQSATRLPARSILRPEAGQGSQGVRFFKVLQPQQATPAVLPAAVQITATRPSRVVGVNQPSTGVILADPA